MQLQLNRGDYVFTKISPRRYTRVGVVIAIVANTKVVLRVVTTDIGVGTKKRMIEKHENTTNVIVPPMRSALFTHDDTLRYVRTLFNCT